MRCLLNEAKAWPYLKVRLRPLREPCASQARSGQGPGPLCKDLPGACVFHRQPGLGRFKRLALLQEFDGDPVRGADKCHVAVPGRPVDGDAIVEQRLAQLVNVVDNVSQVSEIPATLS